MAIATIVNGSNDINGGKKLYKEVRGLSNTIDAKLL